MNKKTKKSIYGFFVAMGNEIPSLKEKMTVNSGRFGVFYKKEQLISTIKPKKIIINMEIVEVFAKRKSYLI